VLKSPPIANLPTVSSNIIMNPTNKTNLALHLHYKFMIMKNAFFTTLFSLFISLNIFSQTCNNIEIKDGDKSTLIIQVFTNPLSSDKKFMKANEEQREVQVAAYNADVLSGKIKPSFPSSMEFTIKKRTIKDADEYAIGYKVGTEDFYSYLVCRNDTLYSTRNKGIVRVGTADNPIGYSIQGTLVYPLNMKVGDLIPSCEDFGFLFPTTSDVTLYKKVLAGYETVHSTRYGPGVDSRTGQYHENATWDVSTPREVYKSVPVAARQTASVSSYAIQGKNQWVTGEMEVTVAGKKYKAFIIESESWSKSNVSTSYESAEAELNKAQVVADEKLEKKTEKFMMRRNYTNKLGYWVQSSTSWFVPQLGGAVKTISYDAFGAISSVMYSSLLEK
jgi:hypothetical protein